MNKSKGILLAVSGFILSICLVVFGINNNDREKQREFNYNEAVEASSEYPLIEKDWAVNYRVKKQNIYVENIIPGFTFQENLSEEFNRLNGYMAVFVDGKWKMNANQSIFILKNLTEGKHKITLQLKKKDGSDYGIKKHIFVNVR
ncbi:hypothetical protein [Fictibacillus phosphorivorans]|uniref:hypothetical protein n=1 Tax=Fictibacillus phosphorivorans TaxID=1221500 RepID=UPI00204112A0|nr:hypothetical protein [Fictibacillus phosphorivorans]MCM3717284.1 hypothetical protein [Fictibacillus phosphorivorans]MCM3774971.1 hypothetical protein [Fictibacillus phosphorivorans]